jgi:hypothetical protein
MVDQEQPVENRIYEHLIQESLKTLDKETLVEVIYGMLENTGQLPTLVQQVSNISNVVVELKQEMKHFRNAIISQQMYNEELDRISKYVEHLADVVSKSGHNFEVVEQIIETFKKFNIPGKEVELVARIQNTMQHYKKMD